MKTIYKIAIIGALLTLAFLTPEAAALRTFFICPYCGSHYIAHACIP